MRMVTTGLGLRVTPHGHLVCAPADDAPGMDGAMAARLAEAFAQGSGHGLLRLGAAEAGQALPPVFVWWRGFAMRHVTALCLHGDGTTAPAVPAPTESELAELVLTKPTMAGAEYLTPDVLRALWAEIGRAVSSALAATAGLDLQGFLKGLNPAWNLVGRVH